MGVQQLMDNMADVFAEINEDVLRDIDTNPINNMDATIEAQESVFDNKDIFDKIEKLRQEITAETVSTNKVFGLESDSKTTPTTQEKQTVIDVKSTPVGSSTNPYSSSKTTTATSTTSSNPYANPYGGYGRTTTQQPKEKSRDERINDYVDKIFDSVGKRVTDRIEKENADITKKKSNWTIFDMHEEKIEKEKKLTPKEKKKLNKKPLLSDEAKMSLLETVVLAGKVTLFTLLQSRGKGDK